jgi:hypothetical protein
MFQPGMNGFMERGPAFSQSHIGTSCVGEGVEQPVWYASFD